MIDLSGVKVKAASATLVKAAADKWGTSGSNGGNVALTAITGDGHAVYCDASAAGSSALGGKTYTPAGGEQLKPE